MKQGTVYLIHFDRPYQHARHYIGWTNNLRTRMECHRRGDGARLMAVIKQASITWTLARTWPGTRELERKLKGRHSGVRLCPICQKRAGLSPARFVSLLPG